MEQLKSRKILITGGTGFVGSHLVEKLLDQENRVVIPYRSRNPYSYFFSKKLDKKSILVSTDIREEKNIFEILLKYEIEYVYHLAAQAIVTTAYIDPQNTFDINIMGTVHLLESIRRCPHVKGVVVASSDKAYGKSNNSYKEEDALRGDHPYEVSKSCTDLIATSYAKTYGIPIVTTRFGNIYGEGDLNFSRIIPGIMHALSHNDELYIRSNGKYIRDYLYVKDVVRGYIALMENIDKTKGEAFNFGSEETLTVFDVIRIVEKKLHKKVRFKILNSVINEIPFQSLDYSKIKRVLGWAPKETIKLTAKRIYRWYKKANHTYE